MRSYNFKNIDRIFAVGGMHGNYREIFDVLKGFLNVKPEDADAIHPKELERRERKEKRMASIDTISIEEARRNLSMRLKKITVPPSINKMVKGSLIVVLGDSGFGFTPEKKIIKFLTDKNKILAYNDINVVFIRGNNDDPSYFDGEKINFSNIKAIPDYSLLETKNKNILCVGGAISADRIWKKEQEARIGKKTYWEDEAPVFHPEAIMEILESGRHIDYVLSHSAPSFLNIDTDRKTILHDWEEKDKSLDKDMDEERICMDRIFECLRDNGSKPEFWGFGHFTNNLMESRANTVFESINTSNINKTIDEDLNYLEFVALKEKMFNSSKSARKMKKISLTDEIERIGDIVGRGVQAGPVNGRRLAEGFEFDANEIAEMFNDEENHEEAPDVEVEVGEGEDDNGINGGMLPDEYPIDEQVYEEHPLDGNNNVAGPQEAPVPRFADYAAYNPRPIQYINLGNNGGLYTATITTSANGATTIAANGNNGQ